MPDNILSAFHTLNPSCNPVRLLLVWPPFYRWGNRSTERLRYLSEVTEQVSGRARVQTRSLVPESRLLITTWNRMGGVVFLGSRYLSLYSLKWREGLEDLAVKAPTPPHSLGWSKCRYLTLKTWKGGALTEQVLNCRKVKYGTGTWEAAIRARRVKTNFKTEPQTMIWRDKPIYVLSHNNYSNAFHLPHPFLSRRPKKFTIVITILPSWGLGPAEDGWGLSRYTQGKGKHWEVNAEITE